MKSIKDGVRVFLTRIASSSVTVLLMLAGIYTLILGSQHPQSMTVFAKEVTFHTSEAVLAVVDTIGHLTTGTTNTAQHGRWENNQATIFIDSKNPDFRSAYQTAVMNWNLTGAFHFTIVNNRHQADIVALDVSDPQTEAAGMADSSTNLLTHYYSGVTLKLNAYYLLDPRYGYDQRRIIYTAEHELGHAIGLGHEVNRVSVMELAGSFHGIQPLDIQAVTQLYHKGKEI